MLNQPHERSYYNSLKITVYSAFEWWRYFSVMLPITLSRNKRQNCEESGWRSQCPCLTLSAAMSCLDTRISLVPKDQLIVPSTLLAPTTEIRTQSHRGTYAQATDIWAIFSKYLKNRLSVIFTRTTYVEWLERKPDHALLIRLFSCKYALKILCLVYSLRTLRKTALPRGWRNLRWQQRCENERSEDEKKNDIRWLLNIMLMHNYIGLQR